MNKEKQRYSLRKRKKQWITTMSTVAIMAGTVVVTQLDGNSTIIGQFGVHQVSAATLPSGATKMGTLNGADVIKSPTKDLGSPTFQQIVNTFVDNSNLKATWLVSDAAWTSKTQAVGGTVMSTSGNIGLKSAYALGFKADGFQAGDKGYVLKAGQSFKLTNVGSAVNSKTKETVPLDMIVTVNSWKTSSISVPSNALAVGVRNNNGVITIAGAAATNAATTGSGGQTEGGGSGGGASAKGGIGYIEQMNYTVTLINQKTGQALPANDTAFIVKASDVDGSQLATLDSNGVFGYAVSNDTVLKISGNGLVSPKNKTVITDAKTLSPNAYVAVKKSNSVTVDYKYTDGAGDHFDIVTALFGNTGLELETEASTDFNPHKFDLSKGDFDLTGTKLLDDDSELKDRYAETKANPYADKKDNNEKENINTDIVERGSTLNYQLWLDTTKLDSDGEYADIGMTDDYDEKYFTPAGVDKIKVYDGKDGKDVTSNFSAELKDGKLSIKVADSAKKNGAIDTTKVPFGRYYKIVFSGTVNQSAPSKTDIVNIASQYVTPVDAPKVEKPTEKRVNKVKENPNFNPHKFDLNTSKADLAGTTLLDDDKELSNRYADTAKDPYADKKDNNEKFNINTDVVNRGDRLIYQLWMDTTAFKNTENIKALGMDDDFDERYLIPDAADQVKVYDGKDGKDVTSNFVVAIKDGKLTIRVAPGAMTKDGFVDTTKVPFGRYYKIEFGTTVKDDAPSKTDIKNVGNQLVTFSDSATPVSKPTETRVNKVKENPSYTPHKFDLSEAGFDLTGDSLLDDDSELTDRYADTKADPYADKKDNNETVNVNTDTVYKSDRLNYQLWLDTTKFTVKDKVKSLGMDDTYDANYFIPDGADHVKIHDGKTGEDVTSKFKIAITDGKLSIDVAEDMFNEKGLIDTTKFEFGRYYKIDFGGTVSEDTPVDTDILNVASQRVAFSDGTTGEKLTETRVNKVVERPDFNPHKFDLAEAEVDLTGDTLLDDDSEMEDRYGDTADDPYNDKVDNNEEVNINTDVVARNSKINYQLWLDTTNFTAKDKHTDLGMTDDYDENLFVPNGVEDVKVYDGVTGEDVTANFKAELKDGKLTVKVADSAKTEDGLVDQEKVPYGRYYKIDFAGKVASDAPSETDIINVASQFVSYKTGKVGEDGKPVEDTQTSEKPTETRVNKVLQPEFEPHKFDLSEDKVDLTGDALLDDDDELADRYADTAKDVYADKTDNNEDVNINTDTLNRKDKVTYQLWLDTTKFSDDLVLQELGMTDDFDENGFTPDGEDTVKVYDGETGDDVTAIFDVTIKDGVLDVHVNDSAKDENGMIDREKVPYGRYYKIDFSGQISENAKYGADIKNVANQYVTDKEGNNVDHDTETRVNKVATPEPPAPTPNQPTPEAETFKETGAKIAGYGAAVLAAIAAGVAGFINRDKIKKLFNK